MRAVSSPAPSQIIACSLAIVMFGALLLPLRPSPAPAQNAPQPSSAALISEALDKQVDLDVNDVLPGAIRAIETRTAVPIKADPAVWDLLPWGEQTNITAKIKNQTLRQALTAMTQKLGLTFTVGDQAVILQPMPALRRLPSLATVQELRALDVLATSPMPLLSGDKGPNSPPTVQQILTTVDVQLSPDRLSSPYALENRLPPEIRAMTVDLTRNGTLLDALEAIVRDTPATWYPWGKSIVVVPKTTHIRNQLSLRTFTSRYNGAEVGQVLEDLRKRSGVDFTIDPGALQRIPPEFRMVRVFWDNVTVSQALESLKGFTGLDYKVTDNGIAISNPSAAGAAPAGGGGGGGDPVIATFTIENGMTIFIRDSQVPPELKSYLRYRTQKELDAIRALAAQSGVPLIAPATQPATTQPAKAVEKPKDL